MFGCENLCGKRCQVLLMKSPELWLEGVRGLEGELAGAGIGEGSFQLAWRCLAGQAETPE